MKHLNALPKATTKARSLRQRMTGGERIIFATTGIRFRRQFAIGKYILDFYCPKLKLCIEVDGDWHDLRKEKDDERDAFLLAKGIVTLRVKSIDLFRESEVVFERIFTLCSELRSGLQ